MYFIWNNIKKTYVHERIDNSIDTFFSKKYNKNFNTEQGDIYISYNNPCYKKEMPTCLSDFYIFGAFRPYQVAGHSYDVCSLKGIQLALEKGTRFHYIDVWSSNPFNFLDNEAYPIVRNKTLMPNTGKALNFKDVCELYSKNTWSSTNYPFILYLNINENVQKNKFVLRKTAKILWENFQGRFPPSKYSFGNKNIGEIPITEAMNKIIILTNIYPDDGYFQEITHGVINTDTQNSGTLIEYNTGHKNYGGIQSHTSNMQSVVDRNRTHLGIVIPEEKIAVTNLVEPGTDLFQIPPKDSWKFGFHIVCVNLQKPGPERDLQIKMFKKKSFVLREDGLRNIPCPKSKVLNQNKKASYAPRNIDVYDGYFKHDI
jgi:hypothetical protein